MIEGKNFNAYKGIIPPMVTPLTATDQLDIEGTERLVEHILSADVSGIFLLGTTGEAPHLSYRLRKELIQRVTKQVAGRVKVLVGVSDTSIVEATNLAKKAADAGADAVVATPPFYFATAQPELIHFYTTLANGIPLPMFLYNMPVHTKVVVEPATIKAVAEACPNVIGFKDSSANMSYFRAIQFLMKDHDFPLFVGPEEMTADAVLLGAAGGVNGGANMFPWLYTGLYKASVNRDFELIEVLRNKVLEISSLIYAMGKYGGSSYLQGLRCALSVLGICDDFIVAPFQRLEKEDRKVIAQRLESLEMEAFQKMYDLKPISSTSV